VCRHLPRQGWLEGEDESAVLSERAGCGNGLDALQMSSITYRIATGAQAGRKVATLQTIPADEDSPEGDAGKVGRFSLHACDAAEAHESQKLERLCRYIARLPDSVPWRLCAERSLARAAHTIRARQTSSCGRGVDWGQQRPPQLRRKAPLVDLGTAPPCSAALGLLSGIGEKSPTTARLRAPAMPKSHSRTSDRRPDRRLGDRRGQAFAEHSAGLRRLGRHGRGLPSAEQRQL